MKLQQTVSSLLLTLGMAASVYAQSSAEVLQQSDRMRNLTSTEKQNYATKGVPSLYEGELDDLGPQFLLTEEQKRQRFQFLTDVQLFHSSNVDQREINRTETNVFVWTSQASWDIIKKDVQGWEAVPTVGFRYQKFQYGLAGKKNQTLFGGNAVDTMDFDNRSAYTEVSFSKGMWRSTIGATYNSLIAGHGTQGNFYYEWVPAWNLSRAFQLTDKTVLVGMFDTAYHASRTHGMFDRNNNLNLDYGDKWDNGVSVVVIQSLTERLSAQVGASCQYSEYLDNVRDRGDWLGTVNGSLNYNFNKWIGIRMFTSYDVRDSSETTAEDYENWNVGGGVTGVVRF